MQAASQNINNNSNIIILLMIFVSNSELALVNRG